MHKRKNDLRIYFIRRPVLIGFVMALIGSTLAFLVVTYRAVRVEAGKFNKTGHEVVRRVDIAEKLVALTFDDGPGINYTVKILDLLKLYQVKATFFVIGEQAEQNTNVLIRELKEGHEIGGHMYAHREVCRISAAELDEDLQRFDKTMHNLTQKPVRLYRPTSGFYNEKIIRVARGLNYTVVLWSMDSRDWTGLSGGIIARNILKSVTPGSIILFHDFGGNRSNTLVALRIILPQLIQRGYRFITVSDLLERGKGRRQ